MNMSRHARRKSRGWKRRRRRKRRVYDGINDQGENSTTVTKVDNRIDVQNCSEREMSKRRGKSHRMAEREGLKRKGVGREGGGGNGKYGKRIQTLQRDAPVRQLSAALIPL